MPMPLTRRQQAIIDHLQERGMEGPPPTLAELAHALGLQSKGSLHKHIQALIEAGYIEPMNRKQRGVRLAVQEVPAMADDPGLPWLGYIAAGRPIEAIANPEHIPVPPALHTDKACYVLQVKGDSMIEEGILDGDWVVIEQRDSARNGEIVVALVDGCEATLKRIEQKPGNVILHPANPSMEPMHYHPDQVQIQGVLVGQMRSYC